MKKTALIASALFVLPFVAAAQGNLNNITNLIQSFGGIVAIIIPILVGCAIAFFFYGLIKYIREPEKADGKKIMIAGIVSLFIMVSIWGILQFAQSALLGSTNQQGTLVAPRFSN